MTPHEQTLALVQWGIATALLGLTLPILAMATVRAVRLAAGWEQRWRWTTVAAVVVAAALRLLVVPKWIATVFIGYRSTAEAIRLFPVPHYGIGVTVFNNALFGVTPADHHTILWANAVVGVLTIPLLAALAATLLRSQRTGALTALLVALVPLFVRNDGSDANNVPILWWTVAGLLLWLRGVEGSRASSLLAMPPLLLAAVSRPEMPLLIGALVPLFAAAHASGLPATGRRPWRDPVVIGGTAIGALLLVPHGMHILASIDLLRHRESLHGPVLRGPTLEPRRNVVLHMQLYPIALLLGAFAAAFVDSRRLPRIFAVLLAALIAHTLTLADVDWANVARVQVPEALFVTMAAAHGLGALVDRLPRPGLVAPGLAVAVAATAVPTAVQLFQPTNEHTEEALIDEAFAALPRSEPFVLLRLGSEDRDDPYTHLFFPDYRLSAEQQSMSLSAFLDRPQWTTPVYAYLGLRCYARFRPWGTPAPDGTMERTECRRVRSELTLVPVFERKVPNRGDVWIPYWGTAPELDVGLYRVAAPPAALTHTDSAE